MDIRTIIDLAKTDPSFASEIDGAPIPEDWYLYEKFGGDYERYKEILRDAHFISRIRTRMQAVLGRGLRVWPASKSQKDRLAARGIASMLGLSTQAEDALGGMYFAERSAHEFAERRPTRTALIPYDTVSQRLLWGLVFGHTELVYDLSDRQGLLVPGNFRVVDRNRIHFAYPREEDAGVPFITDEPLSAEDAALANGHEIRILTRRNWAGGDRIPRGRVIHFSFGSPDGRPWGLGLAFQGYPLWMIKNKEVKTWVLHAGRLGSPPTKGSISGPLNRQDPHEMAAFGKFVAFLKSISPNSWFAGPDKFKVEVIETAVSNPDFHERLIKFADDQMSELIWGDRSYAEKESGSRAAHQSQVQERSLTVTDADCSMLDEALQEYLWDEVSALNFPGANPPLVRRETYAERIEREERIKDREREEASRQSRIESDRTLIVEMAARPSDDYIKQYYPGWEFTPVPPGGAAPGGPDAVTAPEPEVEIDESFLSVENFPDFTEWFDEFESVYVWGERALAAEPAEFGEKAKCGVGLSCGMSCVEASSTCAKSISAAAAANVARVRSLMAADSKGPGRPLTKSEKAREVGYLESDQKWIQGEIDKLAAKSPLSAKEQKRLDLLKSDLAAKAQKAKDIESGLATMAGGSGAGTQSPFFKAETEEERKAGKQRDAERLFEEIVKEVFKDPISAVLAVGADKSGNVIGYFAQGAKVIAARMTDSSMAYRIASQDGKPSGKNFAAAWRQLDADTILEFAGWDDGFTWPLHDRLQLPADSLDFAERAKAKCGGGLSCGSVCVDSSFTCAKQTSAEAKTLAARLEQILSALAPDGPGRPLTKSEKAREVGYLESDQKWIQGEIDKLAAKSPLSAKEQKRLDLLKSDLAAKAQKAKDIESGLAFMAGGSGAGAQSPFYEADWEDAAAGRKQPKAAKDFAATQQREAEQMLQRIVSEQFRDEISAMLAAGMDSDRGIVGYFAQGKKVIAVRIPPDRAQMAYRIVSKDGTMAPANFSAAWDAIAYEFGERRWNADARQRLSDGEIKGGFAGPDSSYPIAGPADVNDAWRLAGQSEEPDQVRRNIIKIAKRFGWADSLPESALDWADEAGINFAGASRYVYWQGLKIGIEYEVGQERFGRPMKCAYGYFTRHRGEDGEALDVYLGPYFSSDRIFRVAQVQVDSEGDQLSLRLDAQGQPQLDEFKYMIFFETIDQAAAAYKQQMPSIFFGGIAEVQLDEILSQRLPDFAESRYSHINFKPPQSVRLAAARALEVRGTKPESQRGGTAVGLARARDLSNGKALSPATVRRMKAYFDRHQVDKSGSTWGEQGKGWQAWGLWGGDAGYSWAKKIVRQMESIDHQEQEFAEAIALSGDEASLEASEYDDLFKPDRAAKMWRQLAPDEYAEILAASDQD